MLIKTQTLTALHPSEGGDVFYEEKTFKSIVEFFDEYQYSVFMLNLDDTAERRPLSDVEKCIKEVHDYCWDLLEEDERDECRELINDACTKFRAAVNVTKRNVVLLTWSVEYDSNVTLLTLQDVTLEQLEQACREKMMFEQLKDESNE